MDQHEEKGGAFPRFWRQKSGSLLAGLACTMLLCLVVGLRTSVLPLPVWVLIGLAFWGARLWSLYRLWRREQGPEDKS